MKNQIISKKTDNITDCCKQKACNVPQSKLLQIMPCKAELISLIAEKEVREAELMIEAFLYSV